jgi:mycothiol synthase
VLRTLRESDVDVVVAVYAEAWGAARPIDRVELLAWLRNPAIAADALRVIEVDGTVVGYGDVSVENDEVALEVAAPGCWPVFLGWAEDVARRYGARRVRTLSYGGTELGEAAAARGYRLWRSNYTMTIELDDVLPHVPAAPAGLVVRAFHREDTEPLRRALNEVFASDPFFIRATPERFREFYLRARAADPSLWLLAWDDDDLAGFVLAFPERPGEPDVGAVHSLGVRQLYRHRGIGELLVLLAFRRLHERGLRRVALGVDASNQTGALRLYERVGMHVTHQADNWVLDLPSPP